MTSPFPLGLTSGTARRQAAALLALFYGIAYGGMFLVGDMRAGIVTVALSALVLGMLMLLATAFFVRNDVSWRDSLGLGRQPVGSMLRWSLLGFVGTYVVNVVLIGAYLTAHGNIEAVAAQKMTSLGKFAELPAEAILPLAAFAAVWEETVFRGFLLGRLRASMPAQDAPRALLRRDVLAIVLTGLFFGLGHGYQGVLGILQTTAVGVALGGLVVWRKSIWPAIGAHLAIDAFGLIMIKVLKPLLDTVMNLNAVP